MIYTLFSLYIFNIIWLVVDTYMIHKYMSTYSYVCRARTERAAKSGAASRCLCTTTAGRAAWWWEWCAAPTLPPWTPTDTPTPSLKCAFITVLRPCVVHFIYGDMFSLTCLKRPSHENWKTFIFFERLKGSGFEPQCPLFTSKPLEQGALPPICT